jgi:hypothetical protein
MTNKLKIIDIVLLSTYTETLTITEHLYWNCFKICHQNKLKVF